MFLKTIANGQALYSGMRIGCGGGVWATTYDLLTDSCDHCSTEIVLQGVTEQRDKQILQYE